MCHPINKQAGSQLHPEMLLNAQQNSSRHLNIEVKNAFLEETGNDSVDFSVSSGCRRAEGTSKNNGDVTESSVEHKKTTQIRSNKCRSSLDEN